MLKRYHITLGATTSNGGEVISASHFRRVGGVPVALEDDQVRCPKCHSVGVIKPQGPRVSERVNGRQVALQDDLCICKCNPPPPLIANQTLACQIVNAD